MEQLQSPPARPWSSSLVTPGQTATVTATDLLAAFSPRRTPCSLSHEKRLSQSGGTQPTPQTTRNDVPKTPSATRVNEAQFMMLPSPWSDLDTPSASKRLRLAPKVEHSNSTSTVDDEIYESPTPAFDRILRPRIPSITTSRSTSNRSKSSTNAQPRHSAVRDRLLQKASKAQIQSDIASNAPVRRDKFLLSHKSRFVPLLPDQNYISELELAYSSDTDHVETATFRSLESQPSSLRATLKDYQLTGLSFLIWLHDNRASGILGDEMGLGKTLQTLSLFQYLEEQKHTQEPLEELRPYLIVCPLSVVGSWLSEAQKWTPELGILRIHGSPQERKRLKQMAVGAIDRSGASITSRTGRKRGQQITYSDFSQSAEQRPYKVIVTSYEVFAAEQTWFRTTFTWRYVVLDEGHKIKNQSTQLFKALQGVRAEHRLLLTGTPLQNDLTEMWALLHWLYPDVFTHRTSELFKRSFDLSKGSVSTVVLDDVRRLLELICLRRLKDSSSVNLGLPPRTEVLLYAPLTPLQHLWYTRILTGSDSATLSSVFHDTETQENPLLITDANTGAACSLQRADEDHHKASEPKFCTPASTFLPNSIPIEDKGATAQNLWQRLMNLVLQLRKVCIHPYLIPGAAPDPYNYGEHVVLESGKFLMLHKLVQELALKQGKKVLIFSGFTGTLDLVEEMLDILGGGSTFKHSRFDGGSSRARRNLAIRLYNDSQEHRIMLISTRAGGLGINLTAATEAIFMDEDWNPQVTLQAEARVHRIGQSQPVTVYKLCTQGTVEEQMLGRIRKKLYLSAKVTEDMQNVNERSSNSGNQTQPSSAGKMPQLDNSALKSLIRRGAKALTGSTINAEEMLGWDFQQMLDICRDRSMDQDDSSKPISEEQWLAIMEKVECANFNGKQHTLRKQRAPDDSPDDIIRADRRIDKNTTVIIDGFAVKKEYLQCSGDEAMATLAGKDLRLSEPSSAFKRAAEHQTQCQICFANDNLVCCNYCPRAVHKACLDEVSRARLSHRGFSFACPQHRCAQCQCTTIDAGGMLYRCRWCILAWCEDCLGSDGVALVGDTLPEYQALRYPPHQNAFYICCNDCRQKQRDNEGFAGTTGNMHAVVEASADSLSAHPAQHPAREHDMGATA